LVTNFSITNFGNENPITCYLVIKKLVSSFGKILPWTIQLANKYIIKFSKFEHPHKWNLGV